MRARSLVLLTMILVVVSAARAQFGGPGGSSGTQLAQFQPGFSPQGSNLDLAPGQTVRLALYCADLFADTPTDRVSFAAPTSDGTVMLASGQETSLADALAAGLLHARGRGAGDPLRRGGGPSFDLFLTNTTDQPLRVAMAPGTLFVPAGQPAPEALPGVRRLFAAARASGRLGADTLAHAVWATRGFTREDVEETMMARLSGTAAREVQQLLAAADLGYDFDPGRGEYAKLFQEKQAELGTDTPSVVGSAVLPSGKNAQAEVVADAAGRAVVALSATTGSPPLYYAGQVMARRPDRLVLKLLHLKTGRPLEVARSPILVKLAS